MAILGLRTLTHLLLPETPRAGVFSLPNKPNSLLFCSAPALPNVVVSSTEGVCLTVGAHVIPHPDKVEKGGEDAFLTCSYGGGVIAVADGVSGWAERDVNPALFSRELISHALNMVEDEEVNYDPRSLIRKAHAATSSAGSATVVVAMLENNGTLKIANLGDCGVRVIRRDRIVYTTSPQEHYFDCPYQLSSESNGQTFIDATVTSVELMEEDVVVMGSDGLFDNVFDQEIISVTGAHPSTTEAGTYEHTLHPFCCLPVAPNHAWVLLPMVAKALAILAYDHSKDPGFDSPYSQEARSQGRDVPWWKKILGMKLTGGKVDDITVIVGRVKSTLSS